MNKAQIFSLIIAIGAFLDTIYSVLAENEGVLVEFGISPKVTKVVMLLGLLFTAFNKSITASPKVKE